MKSLCKSWKLKFFVFFNKINKNRKKTSSFIKVETLISYINDTHIFHLSLYKYNIYCVNFAMEGEEWEIMRGTWYYDGSWIPLETEHSKVIEEVHLKLFQKERKNNQSISNCDTNAPHSYKGILFIQFYFLEFLKSISHILDINIKVFVFLMSF